MQLQYCDTRRPNFLNFNTILNLHLDWMQFMKIVYLFKNKMKKSTEVYTQIVPRIKISSNTSFYQIKEYCIKILLDRPLIRNKLTIYGLKLH